METKGTSTLKGALMAVMAVAAILIGNLAINEARDTKTMSLSSWFAAPAVHNIEGEPQTEFSPGDGLILHYSVERQPLTCWAVWVDMLQGPVTYQFPAARSQVFVDKVTRVTIDSYKVLPDPMPRGEYQVIQMAFPVCDGREVKPFKHDTGIRITIK